MLTRARFVRLHTRSLTRSLAHSLPHLSTRSPTCAHQHRSCALISRHLTWAGRFFVSQGAATGASAGTGFGGAEGGPVVLYDATAAVATAGGAGIDVGALVLSPLDNPHGTIMGAAPPSLGWSLPLASLLSQHAASNSLRQSPPTPSSSSPPPKSGAVGINSYATAAPAGFTVASVAKWSPHGVTDAMHAWGATLLQRHSNDSSASSTTAAATAAATATATATAAAALASSRAGKSHDRAVGMTTKHFKPWAKGDKLDDMSSTMLSYWTDNGAYYDWYAYEPDITSKGVPQDVLRELAATFSNGTYGVQLPVAAFMLDAYWMYNERPNGNCKVNDSFSPVPFPRPANLSQELGGAALVLYNGPQCGDTT
jgi:hypothetical protein